MLIASTWQLRFSVTPYHVNDMLRGLGRNGWDACRFFSFLFGGSRVRVRPAGEANGLVERLLKVG